MTLLDSLPGYAFFKDVQGRYVMANQNFCRACGQTSQTITGKTDHDLFPPDVADAVRGVDLRVAASGAGLTAEEVVPHDGKPHTYVSVKCPLWNEEGKPYAVFGISTDISERKHAEEAIHASEERTRLIVETALDAVVTMDAGGVITGWNPQARATFGWTSEEALGRSLAETIGALQAAGKQVMVLGDTPSFEIDPIERVAVAEVPAEHLRARRLKIPNAEDPGFDMPNFVDSDRRAAAAIAEVLAATPGVTLAEVKPALCKSPTQCYYRDGDNLLYADTHHLTPAGASFALRGFQLPAL